MVGFGMYDSSSAPRPVPPPPPPLPEVTAKEADDVPTWLEVQAKVRDERLKKMKTWPLKPGVLGYDVVRAVLHDASVYRGDWQWLFHCRVRRKERRWWQLKPREIVRDELEDIEFVQARYPREISLTMAEAAYFERVLHTYHVAPREIAISVSVTRPGATGGELSMTKEGP